MGLGTVSTEDKKPRQKSPGRATSEPNPILQHRSSSESIRSDTSVTSGQLTPAEPMVYNSPSITHENVFEVAFQRAEDKIRLQEGDHTFIYNTWRSEEMRGEPVSNRYGRRKVELERIDGDDDGDTRPRWERVLNEKFPEKLAELYQRKIERKGTMTETVGTFAEKMQGQRARTQLDIIRGIKDEANQPGDANAETQSHSTKHKGWDKLLGGGAHKHYGAVKGMVDSLTSGHHDIPESAKEPPTGQ